MKLITAILIFLLIFVIIIAYCCLVIASKADEDAEQMYREWVKKHDDEEAYEESVYREGYRKGKEETIKELMAWHDKVCEEMAKRHTAERHMILGDGTLVVNVSDATKVTRVLVEDEKKNGDLYYNDRPKGEWIEGKYDLMCSNCENTQGCEEFPYCPYCGADMRGEDNE